MKLYFKQRMFSWFDSYDIYYMNGPEETGAVAESWTPLGSLIASPGCYDEVLYLYLAQDLHYGATDPDEDEFLAVERMPLDQLARLCLEGEVTDAKTVCAVLKAKLLGL